MTRPFLRAYTQLARSRPATAAACTRWAAWPRRSRSRTIRPPTTRALAKVARRQAARGRRDGHDGTWVAHPGLVPHRARDLRRAHAGAEPDRPAARGRARHRGRPARACPTGRDHRGRPAARTSASACSTSRPGCAGSGCVPIYNLMEDAATAEISRAQVWQWIRHGAALDDGRTVDARARSRSVRDEELRRSPRAGRRRALARRALRRAPPSSSTTLATRTSSRSS